MKQLVSLEHYFFPVVRVNANPRWEPGKNKKIKPHAEIVTTCNEIAENENTYEVQLNITIANTDEHPSQYDIELTAYGILTAHPELHDKKNNMRVTGSSILYSASREFLLGIMSRGPWPPIMLHAMPFNISKPEDSKLKSGSETKTSVRVPKIKVKSKP